VVNGSTFNVVLATAIVRGRKITDYGQMEAVASDGLSIAKYGRRTMKMSLPSVDDLEYAQYIADYELKRRKDPRGVISEVTLKSHGLDGGNLHTHQLARTIGDVITISETQTGHSNKRYVIIGESHRLTAGATLWETTWHVEPAVESPYLWKLGTVGRGELGTNTRLGY
jgi:hypothetical protein